MIEMHNHEVSGTDALSLDVSAEPCFSGTNISQVKICFAYYASVGNNFRHPDQHDYQNNDRKWGVGIPIWRPASC